jgi:hypothetical protein
MQSNWSNMVSQKSGGKSRVDVSIYCFVIFSFPMKFRLPTYRREPTSISERVLQDWMNIAGLNWMNIAGLNWIYIAGLNWMNIAGLNWMNIAGLNWMNIAGLNWMNIAGLNWMYIAGLNWMNIAGLNWMNIAGLNWMYIARLNWMYIAGLNWMYIAGLNWINIYIYIYIKLNRCDVLNWMKFRRRMNIATNGQAYPSQLIKHHMLMWCGLVYGAAKYMHSHS